MRTKLVNESVDKFINEYYDGDYDSPENDPDYTMLNGRWVNKNSREYQRWYEEEGEFDDVEGREYRRRGY